MPLCICRKDKKVYVPYNLCFSIVPTSFEDDVIIFFLPQSKGPVHITPTDVQEKYLSLIREFFDKGKAWQTGFQLKGQIIKKNGFVSSVVESLLYESHVMRKPVLCNVQTLPNNKDTPLCSLINIFIVRCLGRIIKALLWKSGGYTGFALVLASFCDSVIL